MSPTLRCVALLCGVLVVAIGLAIADSERRHPYDRLPPIGAAVPAFDLPSLGGGRLTSANFDDQPAVLVLWSTSCGASRLALDGLLGVQQAYADRGVRVVILADDADAASLQAFMDRADVQLPVAYAGSKLHDLFDGSRRPWQKSFPLPSYLVLDATGRVAARAAGVPLDEVQSGDIQLAHLRSAIERSISQ